MSSTTIAQADRIVGIEDEISEWLGPNTPSVNTYRRGAYCAWLIATKERKIKAKLAMSGLGPLEDIAAEVVRIHAASQPKQPDDGLPPGPLGIYIEDTVTSTWLHVSLPIGAPREQADVLRDYIARCGSPAVRRLLAAFEVTETKQDGSMGLCCSDSGVCFHVWHTEPLRDPSSVICWLTPRSKP